MWETLEVLGMSQTELAEGDIGLEKTINEIIEGKAAVTYDILALWGSDGERGVVTSLLLPRYEFRLGYSLSNLP